MNSLYLHLKVISFHPLLIKTVKCTIGDPSTAFQTLGRGGQSWSQNGIFIMNHFNLGQMKIRSAGRPCKPLRLSFLICYAGLKTNLARIACLGIRGILVCKLNQMMFFCIGHFCGSIAAHSMSLWPFVLKLLFLFHLIVPLCFISFHPS